MRVGEHIPHLVIEKAKTLNWKKVGFVGGISLILLLALVQVFYPSDRLLPFARIDGMSVAGQKKSDVIAKLDTAYDQHTLDIYMGTAKKPVTSPKLADIDISVDNKARVEAITYPWYLQIIPTSLFWAQLSQPAAPTLTYGDKFATYVDKNLMPSCKQKPTDASLKASGDSLTVVPAENGGICEKDDVVRSIKSLQPAITKQMSIRVARKEVSPVVSDDMAKKLGDTLTKRLAGGVKVTVTPGAVQTVSRSEVLSWLDFATKDKRLAAVVNGDRAANWLNKNVAAKVAVAPGVSYVKTVDFTEVSRVNGTSGQAIDLSSTVRSFQVVVDGGASDVLVTTRSVPPTVKYTRSYSASDAGLSALMKNYANDHPGTFGVSMIELGGKKRRASYNGDKRFVTASTYKLFVAYSLMKQIDAGKRSWDSNKDCFNKMISLSDNACAESFLDSLGLSTVTNDIQAIGLRNSTFMVKGGPYTTADDLTLLLGMIATGQNFSDANQSRLIAAMKANVYRSGIPAGVSGTVADKVGFLDGLLHDAAIVYGPHGTYVLAIMTDGSTWGSIADLAKQLDALHAK